MLKSLQFLIVLCLISFQCAFTQISADVRYIAKTTTTAGEASNESGMIRLRADGEFLIMEVTASINGQSKTTTFASKAGSSTLLTAVEMPTENGNKTLILSLTPSEYLVSQQLQTFITNGEAQDGKYAFTSAQSEISMTVDPARSFLAKDYPALKVYQFVFAPLIQNGIAGFPKTAKATDINGDVVFSWDAVNINDKVSDLGSAYQRLATDAVSIQEFQEQFKASQRVLDSNELKSK